MRCPAAVPSGLQPLACWRQEREAAAELVQRLGERLAAAEGTSKQAAH